MTSPSKENPATQNNSKQKVVTKSDTGKETNFKFPCMIYVKDHMTYKCPLLQECIDIFPKMTLVIPPWFSTTLFLLSNNNTLS